MDAIDSFLDRGSKPSDDIDAFLRNSGNASAQDDDEIGSFLMRSDEPTDKQKEADTLAPEPETETKAFGTVTQASQALVGEFADLLGLPGEAANWIMGKFGVDANFQTGATIRDIGADAGITTREGEAADTAMTKTGQYLGMGLEFIVPFVALGKGATMLKATTGSVTAKTGGITDLVAVPTTIKAKAKDLASTMALPFVTSPRLASMSEVSAGVAGGAGAYYGGKEYGPTGEMIGGLLGGIGAQATPAALAVSGRAVAKHVLPMTQEGGGIRASGRMQELVETSPQKVIKKIASESGEVLPGANITPARLAGDKHLIAMEESLVKDNPALSLEFKLKRDAVNDLATAEMERLGGSIPIEKTQAYFKGRIEHVESMINKQLDSVLVKAKDAIERLSSKAGRVNANNLVEKQIQDSLTKARNIETETWKKVDRTVTTTTSEAIEVFRKEIKSRESSADPKDIEEFLGEFLGKFNKDGEWVGGKFGPTETVGQLTTFRSRVTTAMREEAGKDAPNWNRHRIMDDIQEAILKDLEKVDVSSNLSEAIAVSRNLNEKFKSGTLRTILGHHKTGGKLAPELTLEGMTEGSKAGVQAKEIIAASPESKPMIEDFIKSKIANSLIDKATGRLKYKKAKTYVDNNEMLMDMFPALRADLEHAIGQEERAASSLLKGKAAVKQLMATSIAKISGMKPGRVLTEILRAPYPTNAMRKAMAASNAEGRAGIKNDIASFLLNKSKTGNFTETNTPILSGRKMAHEWDKHKKIFLDSKALTKEEGRRIEIIANTLIKNESEALPNIGEVVAPTRGIIQFVAKVAGAQSGARISKALGAGTIQIPHYSAEMAGKAVGELDTARAIQLLTDAIQDRELFNALLTNAVTLTEQRKVVKVLHGWLLAQAVKSLELAEEQE